MRIDDNKVKNKPLSLKPSLKDKLIGLKNSIFSASWKKKIIFLVILMAIGVGVRLIIISTKKSKVTYETAKAEKGTLTVSISGSGTITSGNNTSLTTKVSGIVKKVYVTNGDTVTKGQKIAEVTLDDYAKERQAAAWVAYLQATEAVKQSIADKTTNDINMWKARQTVLDAQEAYDDMLDNDTNPTTNASYTAGERMIIIKTLDETKKAFSVSESKYLNADADITNSNAKVVAALRDYQENSATIVAPSAGVISDLALAEGLVVNANSTTSSTSGATIVSSQTVGKINNINGQLIASVSLSEIDVLRVKANQKVVITLDAYSDKTFTGKVLAVNTTGSVSSGVTSYPVTILLDSVSIDIYPNMAVNAEIITDIVTDALMVPTTAITTSNGTSTVQIKKDEKITTAQVELGIANDSQTVITSGLNEGDEVVTSTITVDNTTSTSSTTSPFSGIGTNSRSSSGTSNSRTGVQIMGGPGGL
ncbi:MAG: efflux RND transporter periplasmic adaptor subunit [Candidatus Shapirobacteria bacterium]|nr:efflux RND transporter periplasmic adaptor subunit [Candidatus Shapirobacteria bacterium]